MSNNFPGWKQASKAIEIFADVERCEFRQDNAGIWFVVVSVRIWGEHIERMLTIEQARDLRLIEEVGGSK